MYESLHPFRIQTFPNLPKPIPNIITYYAMYPYKKSAKTVENWLSYDIWGISRVTKEYIITYYLRGRPTQKFQTFRNLFQTSNHTTQHIPTKNYSKPMIGCGDTIPDTCITFYITNVLLEGSKPRITFYITNVLLEGSKPRITFYITNVLLEGSKQVTYSCKVKKKKKQHVSHA